MRQKRECTQFQLYASWDPQILRLFSEAANDNMKRDKTQSLLRIEISVLDEHDGSHKNSEDDESYSLRVEGEKNGAAVARIVAKTVWGASYGLTTFTQLVDNARKLRGLPIIITDAPRYPWRDS